MIEFPVIVPFSRPSTDHEEVDAVAGVIRSGWLTTGAQAEAFEAEFRAYTGSPHALAVSSCTAGLHLALCALNVGPGDEVITTPLTYCATVQAIEETGARAVLCDVGPDLNLDPAKLPQLLTRRTRGIVPVHMGGLPCEMGEIWRWARKHGLFVIEDAAHAIGAEYAGARVGAGMSDATVFSFFANKNMTTGEGGMITSPDGPLLERMRLMSRHGVRRAGDAPERRLPWYYEVSDRGLKCNLSDLQAAMGRVQLRKLTAMTAAREAIARRYECHFRDCESLELPGEREGMRHAWHLYIVRLHLETLTIDRDQFTRELRARGVECSVHFIPIPLHPYYRDRFPERAYYAEALRQFPRLISLPIYPAMTDAQLNCVTTAVLEIASRFNCPAVRESVHASSAGSVD